MDHSTLRLSSAPGTLLPAASFRTGSRTRPISNSEEVDAWRGAGIGPKHFRSLAVSCYTRRGWRFTGCG